MYPLSDSPIILALLFWACVVIRSERKEAVEGMVNERVWEGDEDVNGPWEGRSGISRWYEDIWEFWDTESIRGGVFRNLRV